MRFSQELHEIQHSAKFVIISATVDIYMHQTSINVSLAIEEHLLLQFICKLLLQANPCTGRS